MKVIIAIDQSGYWTQLIEAAYKQTWPKDTAFKILTVIEPMPESKLGGSTGWSNISIDIMQKRNKAAEEILRLSRALLSNKLSECSIHTELRFGRARDEIVEAAAIFMPDKIVLGTHKIPSNKLFLGSVPRSIAEHSHCSLELVSLTALPEAENREQIKAGKPSFMNRLQPKVQ